MIKQLFATLLCLATVVHATSLTDSTSQLLQNLNKRQNVHRRQSGNTTIPLSDFPQQCQSGCSPAVNALNTCTDLTCICKQSVETSLQGCLQCTLTADPSGAVATAGQQVAQSYNQECNGAGISSISLAAPTGSANGTSTQTLSGNSTATSTGATSSSAIVTTSASGVSPASPTTPTVGASTTAGVSTSSTPTTTTRSAGIATASANMGYLSFTVLVTLLAALAA